MGVMYPPETEYAKERVRWEAQNSEMGKAGRPYVFKPFPAAMYKAGRPENGLGKHIITETREAQDENDVTSWRHEGFRETPLEAIACLDALQLECATLAAELAFEQKNRLSANAASEVDQARAQHVGVSRHMPMVPTTPIKKRGRPTKVKIAAVAAQE